MKICSNCGFENEDKASVCELCGFEFETPQNKPEQISIENIVEEKPENTAKSGVTENQAKQEKPKKKNGVVIILIVVILILVAVLVLLFFTVLKNNNKSEDSTAKIAEVTQTELSEAATEKATEATTEKVTEAATEAEADEDGWKTEYMAKVMQYSSEDEAMYSIFDIDSNGVPELILSPASFHASGVEIYTYYDGKCHQVVSDTDSSRTQFGVYGIATVNSNYSMLITADYHMNCNSGSLYEFDGEKIIDILNFYFTDYPPETGNENEFNLNGENVTQEELAEGIKLYTDVINDSIIEVGRDYSCNDSSGIMDY